MKTTPQYPYNNLYNMKTHDRIECLTKEIEEEKSNVQPDMHKIYRMEEQKIIEGMFSFDQIGTMYGKYRNPW